MQKTYKTLSSSTVIVINTKNGTRRIEFKRDFIGIGSLRGGVYCTDDEDVQQGIERHEKFRSGFQNQIWTDDKEEMKETTVSKSSEYTDTSNASVTTYAEVRTILKEQYGKTAKEIKSNAQVLALINELGLSFPNLK